MATDSKQISVPQTGMVRDLHPSNLSETQYTFAMNANIESEDGNVNMRSNEHSTLLCRTFGDYKVIGYKNDLSSNLTYFFITNPEDKTSKVVYFEPCGDVSTLTTEQIEAAVAGTLEICGEYKTLIEDDATDPCLNFSIYHPIKTIEIKVEKCGKCIYWTDGYNPPRYVIVEKALEPDDEEDIWYHYHGWKMCGETKADGTPLTRDEFIEENGCVLACEKLRVFPLLDQPCIEPNSIEYGGSLRAGVYQFAVALCDEFGNEMNSYSALTNPVHIFDKQYIRVVDGKWGERTNLGIRLTVSNLDRQASHFKVVVVQNTVGYNGETQPVVDYFVEGIHAITEKTILYYSDLNNKRTTFEHISFKKPVYNTSRGIVTVDNRLLQYGLTAEKEWNLQPMASLLGHFMRWQASVASEDLYKDGNACSLYVGYMRDEVYPFGISFKTSTGYKSPVFTLIPPPHTEARKLAADDSRIQVPVDSVNRYSSKCYETERQYVWQFVNTAGDAEDVDGEVSLLQEPLAEDDECKNPTTIGQTMIVEKDISPSFSPISFTVENINTGDVALYISDNMKEIACSQEGNPVMESICELYTNYEEAARNNDEEKLKSYDKIDAPAFPSNCDNVRREESILSVPYSSIVNPVMDYNYIQPEDMEESSKNLISTVGGEVEDAYSIMVDRQTIDEMESAVDLLYGSENNTFILDEETLALRQPELLLAGVGRNVKILTSMTCTCGCSYSNPCSDPYVSSEGAMSFHLENYGIIGCVGQGNAWCEGNDAGSEELSNKCYFNEKIPQQLLDLYVGRFNDNYSNAVYSWADTGIESDWDWLKNDGVSSSVSTSEFEAEGRGNARFWAGMVAYRFVRNVGRNARWIRIDRAKWWNEDPDFGMVLEMFGRISGRDDETSTPYVRISFWKDTKGTPLNLDSDMFANDAVLTSSNSRVFSVSVQNLQIINKSFFDNNGINSIYISIDSPAILSTWMYGFRNDVFYRIDGDGGFGDSFERSTGFCGGMFMLAKTMNPYVLGVREREIESLSIKADSLTVRATVTFAASCLSCGDSPINCAPRVHKCGDFAYWESSERYPANYELWDSSRLKIDTSRSYEGEKAVAYNNIIQKLTEYYGSPVSEGGLSHFESGTYGTMTTNTVFCQQPIRHYKFPDCYHMPFMSSDQRTMDVLAEIYPMGVLIDDNIVEVFLDFAVDSGFITQEQRDTIIGYELYRGDRRLNRSIVASGLAYDMFKYEDDSGNINLYSSYPYNDMSEDQYNYTTGDRNQYIQSPFPIKGNVWYTFHSPDIHFNKFELPTEAIIDGYQRGMSMGNFVQVEEHPKWTILGPKAYSMAKTLADIEATATLAAQIAEALQIRAQSAFVGLTNNVAIAFCLTTMGMVISQGLAKRSVLYGKYRYDWLNTFINNGPRLNYAYYYTSIGNYNSMTTEITEDGYYRNFLRGLSTVKQINSGIYPISDESANVATKGTSNGIVYVNSIDRESSVFLSFGDPGSADGTSDMKYILNYPSHVANYDNSRVDDPCITGNDQIAGNAFDLTKISSYIASPYMKLKKYKPDQYGSIEDISWVSIGGCGMFNGTKRLVFGGDTFISRFSLKRKFPIFYNNAFHIGDMIPFPYDDYRNVGYPKYFVNYDTGEDALEYTDDEKFDQWQSVQRGSYSYYPNRKSLYNLNGYEGDKYVRGRFYLWFYGIPQFLVESEVNCNFRLEGSQPSEQFYPAVGDYIWWTQEKNVSIQLDNDYKISPIYFARTTIKPSVLPATYERKFYDCAYQRPNGVIWSRADISENSQTDPWLTYKPLDYYEFPTRNGKLIHMKRIESNQLLTRFEDQVSLNNAIDVIKERTTTSAELGTGGLFQSRPLEYNTTDLGYSGTQSTEIVSSEYGHFWVDAKRAQVFQTDPNGKNLQELSVGISHWLKNHLPFKILRYNIINVNKGESMTYEDVDNKFISLGLSLGWDNLYKRVFITKKDYIPVQDAAQYKFDGGKFYYGNTEISLHDTNYFEDVSFTIAYSCKKKEWISYYSFAPDYYIEQQQYFMSGKNYSASASEIGLWTHLLTNRSFLTFYGTTYPFELEVPVKETYNGSILASVEYELDARKYSDNVNYTLDRKVGLDSVIIYNETNNSGELRLVPEEKNNMYQKVSYPKYGDSYTEILDTEVYRRHKINDFFNRVADDRSETPVWEKDVNDIQKELNPAALNYHPTWLDRLRGSWFLMRIKKAIQDRKIIFQWMISEDKRKNR